jgi:hypothetical protein
MANESKQPFENENRVLYPLGYRGGGTFIRVPQLRVNLKLSESQ